MNHKRPVRPKFQGRILMLTLSVFFFSPLSLFAADAQETEALVKNMCSTCHKFEGKEESRFNLKAPDLMWGGE